MTKENKFAFTVKKISNLSAPESGREWFYDTKTAHLAVCVFESGTKTYYRYGRINGKPTRTKLGRVDEISLTGARELCQKVNGEVSSNQGSYCEFDTMGELFQWYLDHHAKPHKKTWQQDADHWRTKMQADWSDRKFRSITPVEMLALQQKVKENSGKYAANRLFEMLNTMFNKAIDMGILKDNPVSRIKHYTEYSRERFLSAEELKRVFNALSEAPLNLRDFVLLSLWTGARPKQVKSMLWEDLSLETKTWIVPAWNYKNGKRQTLVLPDAAVSVLQDRIEIVGTNQPWVFPSDRSPSGHYEYPQRAWETLRQKIDLNDVRIYDLRRTMGSWQAIGGSSLPIIGKSLGHASTQATQVYARLADHAVRSSMESAIEAMQQAGEFHKNE